MDNELHLEGQTDRQTDRQTEQGPRQSLSNSPTLEPLARLPRPELRAQLLAEHICWHQPCLFCAILNGEPQVSDGEALRYEDLSPANRESLRVLIGAMHDGVRQRDLAHQTDEHTRVALLAARRTAAVFRAVSLKVQLDLLTESREILKDSQAWVERSRRLIALLRTATPDKPQPAKASTVRRASLYLVGGGR